MGLLVRRDAVKRSLFWDTAEPYHYVRFDDWDDEHLLMIVGGCHSQDAAGAGWGRGGTPPGCTPSAALQAGPTPGLLASSAQLCVVPPVPAGGEDHKMGSLWPYDPYDRQAGREGMHRVCGCGGCESAERAQQRGSSGALPALPHRA